VASQCNRPAKVGADAVPLSMGTARTVRPFGAADGPVLFLLAARGEVRQGL
jgi:hypothetical protein